ncbi:response regulator [Tahibacter amnicola]|uniref:Response regulator n=1 Tax=Tahibacter amnicola TaxID=2976241 RepID=A0ABY6BCG0_9GAMM|nr:response regulator [Tahibacter amnicola]UXI67733.1 response regulator [Tahibacter amnicola]
MKILLADDHRAVADMLAEALSAVGYEVAVAYDGGQALKKAAEFQPDAAILDIDMPVMNGHAVARKLKENKDQHAISTLIAITGRDTEADRRASADAGFDLHLVKPVPLAIVLRLMAKAKAQLPNTASESHAA